MQYLFGFLGLFVLFLLSAFFSGSESAIFHLPKLTIERLVQRSSRFSILKKREKLLGTILFCNTLVNLGIAGIATNISYQLFKNLTSSGLLILTGTTTYLILVFGEITPKLYGLRHSEKVSLNSLFLLKLFRTIFLPITAPIETLVSLISHRKKSAPITRAELMSLIESDEERWYLTRSERKVIKGLLDFKDKRVSDIMTPKHKIECLPISTKLETILASNLYHSRIPIYQGSPNHIIGILYLKDLLAPTNLEAPNLPESRQVGIRTPYFVSSTISANELFSQFQTKRVHIAVVIDESDNVIGLVTLTDILNAVIGSPRSGVK